MADPIIRIKFDYKEVEKGTRVIKGSLDKVDKSADTAADRFKNLESSMRAVSTQTLTFKKRTQAAAADMKSLNQSVFNLVQGLNKEITNLKKVSTQVSKNISSFDKLEKSINKNTRSIEKNSDAYRNFSGETDKVVKSSSALSGILTGLITLQSISLVIQYADAWAKLSNSIRIFAKDEAALISTREELFRISQKTRTELSAQTTLYNRLKIAQSDLGISETGILKITEAVGYALGVTSTTALEARGALIQLGQAFGSGIVRAEEFNAINEGTPKIMQAAAEGLGLTRSQLRALVLEGQITSDMFSNSLLAMADSLEKEYQSVNKTISQSFTNLRSSLTRFIGELGEATGIYQEFVGVLENANDLLTENSDTFLSASEVIISFTGSISGPLGATVALGLLTTAFRAFTALVVANPLGATFIAAYTATSLAMKGYSELFGVEAENTKRSNDELKKLTLTRLKYYEADNKAGDIFLENTKGRAAEATTYAKQQIAALQEQLNFFNQKATLTTGRDGVERKATLTPGAQAQVDNLKKQQDEYKKYLGFVKAGENELVGIARIAEAISLEKNSLDKENLIILRKSVEIAATEKKVWKERKDAVVIIENELKKINSWEKERNRILSTDRGLVQAEVDFLKRTNNLASEKVKLQEQYKTQLKGTGKESRFAKKVGDDELKQIKIKIKLQKEAASQQNKLLKIRVADGAAARREIEAAKRSGVVGIPEGRKLIEQARKIQDLGTIAAQELLSRGIIPAGVISELDTIKFKLKELTATSAETFKELNKLEDSWMPGTKSAERQADQRNKIIAKSNTATVKAENALQSKLTDIINKNSMSRYQYQISLIDDKIEKEREKNPLVDEGKLATYRKNLIRDLSPIQEFMNSLEDPIIAVENTFVNAFQNMEDSLVNFVKTGKLEWKSLVSSIIEDLVRLEIQQSIIKPLSSAVSGTDIFSSIAGLFNAKGNAFTSSGVQAFGSGGTFTNSIVDKPTMFAHGGGFGLMGEAGDEAILPLTRTTSGNLGVEASGMSSPNIMLNIENNSGQDINAEQVSSSQDGENYILGIVLNAANNNGGFGASLNGAMNKWGGR